MIRCLGSLANQYQNLNNYGFLRDHSCLQQLLLSFLSCVEKSLESSDMIYLDSKKLLIEYPIRNFSGLPAHYGDGLKNTLLLRKEASLGLCFSWFISMIFLFALTSLIFISLQMIPNALIRLNQHQLQLNYNRTLIC